MNKWSILIEVDASNMAEFYENHFDGKNLFVKGVNIDGIMKIETCDCDNKD
jgi:hypothetical protein